MFSASQPLKLIPLSNFTYLSFSSLIHLPDVKTKLSTLQNYFFPRLEILLRHTLDIVAEVYNVNPYEQVTFSYCPSHREKAKENTDYGMTHIGITGRKSKQPLKIFRREGQAFVYHSTFLTYKVLPSGIIYVELLPFRQYVDDAYVGKIASLVKANSEALTPLLSLAHIGHKSGISYCEFLPLYEAISPSEIGTWGIRLVSPMHYFPIDSRGGLNDLILAFVLLYALAESFICIGEGREPNLKKMLEQFKLWYVKLSHPNISGWAGKACPIQKNQNGEMLPVKLIHPECASTEQSKEGSIKAFEQLPELNSYSFVRAGKWWAVLARDGWKCLGCGRSPRIHGITLEVDHVIPRSKGGSDDMSNLQSLCKKCNIGKSNKDDTKLFVESDVLLYRSLNP